MTGHKKNVRIADIAAECALSPITVSRALRQDAAVSESTRTRVIAAAERMGYHPRAKMGRPEQPKAANPTVDIVLDRDMAPTSMFTTELLVSIEQELSARGYDCIVRTTASEYAHFLPLYQELEHSKSSGTMILGYLPVEQLQAVLELLPNAILVDNTGDPRLECAYHSVGFDNVEAARLAVGHLIQTGRRRIALITGDPEHYFSRGIEQGYREALARAGIPVDAALIEHAHFTPRAAADAVRSLAERGIAFDAVFTSDENAVGVLRALHERGLPCPGRVAVAGCDGLPIGEHTIPTLTSVELDYRALGRAAVERLLAVGEGQPPCRMLLLPRLRVRESTGAAHQKG
ncbi:MAG: LacI family DNA-binding transcriptional regulator [Candidatus Hydrogenedentes bacterium]|nr:LacI family DNA-binding transcriptional regulator [Candidatus Hydrogenedentota bacterium]